MSEAATLWIFGTLIGVLSMIIGALVMAFWAHVGHCKAISDAVARIETSIEAAIKRIDTLGERSHDHNDSILIQDGEIGEVMRKLDMDRIPRPKRRR